MTEASTTKTKLVKTTKRQQRKQPNEKNKWPQHPKIQDMEVRNKAYIRVAGFGTSSKTKDTVDPKLDLMSPEVKFGRLLGGTDQRKRHAAVRKLKAYLKARCDISNEHGGISEMDLLKLWKGLWYTLYMADKVPVQDELSKHLAELLWCLAGTEEEDEYAGKAYMDMCEEEDETGEYPEEDGVVLEEIENTLDNNVHGDHDEEVSSAEADSETENSGEEEDQGDGDIDESMDGSSVDISEIPHCRGAHLVSLFVRAFFRTIKREWGNMDKYRVDKFYTLTRLYMHEIFKYMSSRHWNLGIIRLFNDALFEEVLNQLPNGLRYHLIDIALDELAKVNAKAPMPLTEATFLDTMEPYFAICQTGAGGDDSVQNRVMENVLEKFLLTYSVVGEIATTEDDNEEAKDLVFDQVHVGSIAQFLFEIASDPETKGKYRKSIYNMHKVFMRRLKEIGVDVVLDDNDDIENEEYLDEDGVDPITLNEASTEVVQEEDAYEPVAKEESVSPKKKKKKRKREKNAEETHNISEKETKQNPEKEKLKKKKKRTRNEEQESEDVVTISLAEQRAAKGRKKPDTRKMDDGVATPETTEKHVKWKSVNRSKSHKASVKALLNASIPKTSQRTPEKSILLNKGKIRRAGVTKKEKRKKASNYF